MKQKHRKFLATHIDASSDDWISLYSMTHNVSKSEVVREAILHWINSSRLTQQQLIAKLAERINQEWELHKIKVKIDDRTPQLTRQQFLENKRMNLTKLPRHIVEDAIKLCSYYETN